MAAVYRFIVSGRVQGVGFRDATRRRATVLGLSGWVKNRSDGRVEGLACGSDEQLLALRNWLHQGPPAARVAALDWLPDAAEAPPATAGFLVQR